MDGELMDLLETVHEDAVHASVTVDKWAGGCEKRRRERFRRTLREIIDVIDALLDGDERREDDAG
jgi:hypothetical protein